MDPIESSSKHIDGKGALQSTNKYLTNCLQLSMRTLLATGLRNHQPAKWHKENPTPNSWKEHIPYTNVLWIRYLYNWLTNKKASKLYNKWKEYNEFLSDTKEFDRKLVPRTRTTKSSFGSASEVLQYMVEEGWVSVEQAESYGFDSSIFSAA